MSVVKVVQIIGQSPNSFMEAVNNAVQETTRTVRNVKSFQVDQFSGEVGSDGQISNYRASVDIAFVVDHNKSGG